MRAFVVAALLSALAAVPTAAQPLPPVPPTGLRSQGATQSMENALFRAQQEAAARQALMQQNELSRLDHQLRTQQNQSLLQSQTQLQSQALLQSEVLAPSVPPAASGAVPNFDASGLVSIPDSTLADSNARVKAAAEGR